MDKAELEKSLAVWKRRESVRKRLHTVAQQDLYEARAEDEHPRQELVDRRDKRSAQLKEAREMIKRREDQLDELDKGKVRRPFERIRTSVSNSSARTTQPTLIVLHTTESHNRAGLSDIQAIVAWFNNPSSQASSHVIVDDEGISAQCVPDVKKAWTQAAYNSRSLSVEQIGQAAQRKWTEAQLRKTAKYVAFWSQKFNIPITFSTSHGVCEHRHLGAAGGGHHDCGEPYPLERVLELAREYQKNGW